MPTPKMSWQFSADVPNMASVQVTSSPMAVEAVEQINVTIEPGEIDKKISLQGATITSGNNPIKLMVIKSGVYSETLTFKFSANSTTSGSASIKLTTPQIFTESVMNLITDSSGTTIDPKFLIFTNSAPTTADIFIYVVRDATP